MATDANKESNYTLAAEDPKQLFKYPAARGQVPLKGAPVPFYFFAAGYFTEGPGPGPGGN